MVSENKKVCSISLLKGSMLSLFRYSVIYFPVLFFPFLYCHGQMEEDYYEIAVFAKIPKVGGFEIPAIIKGEELYLPATDLFNILKIKNIPSADFESVTGYFISPEATFKIDRSNNTIHYQSKFWNLKEGDLIRTETNLYLHYSYFGKVFGLDCYFSFRDLSFELRTNLELPLIREMRLEEMRKNLTRLKGEIHADTVIKRTYPLFRFGMADWAAFSTQEINSNTNTRLNLDIGAMLAGGEAIARLKYSTIDGFNQKQQHYQWRYVDNDYRVFRQITAGNINSQSTSTLFSPVLGIQFTNTPTTYRRSFGTYTLSERTEPRWLVELYVNNVLVDYIKADASGFFQFQVPLVYGNSIIQLKYYGPWGEEKVKEQNFNIPFNFLPEKTFEYKVSAGFLEDSSLSMFSRVSTNYGLTKYLTIGLGMEYLSSITSSPFMPYLNASWNVLNNLLISGEYTHSVRTKGIVTYRMPSNIQLDINYTKYARDQKAILFNYLEERKVSLTLPLKIKSFSSFNRFSANQIILPSERMINGEISSTTSTYTSGEWMFSGFFFGVNTNLTTYGVFIQDRKPNIYTNLSLSLRLPANFILMPQMQYGLTSKEFISAKITVEKRFREKAFFNLTLQRNFTSNFQMAEMGIRYNFDFAQTGLSVRQSKNSTAMIEYARGSLIRDNKSRFLGTDNQFNVGKGGISIIPYIDCNANGIKDRGESKAYGLDLRSSGGRVEKNERDTTIRILGLDPYTSCFIELNPNSFENISWKLPIKVLNVIVDPEIMKHIEIPIIVVGEASGIIKLLKMAEETGLGRIIVRFFDSHDKLVGSTISEDDGYFSWFGLTPGDYTAQIDSSQLRKIGMISEPAIREFKINAGFDGDLADNLEFRLRMIESDTILPEVKKPVIVTRKDTTVMIVHEVVEELVTITKDSWAIQLGAFKNKANADNLRKNLEKLLGRKVELVIADGFFKVRINEIADRKEVDEIIVILRNNGFTELWIISLRAKQQHVVLVEREDSVIKVVETTIEEPELFESKIFIPMTSEFYSLERPKNSLIEQTIFEIMKSHSSLEKMEFKDIRPVVRIMRTDTTEIIIPGIKGPETIGPATKVRDEIKVDKIIISSDIGERVNPSPAVMMVGAPPEKPVVPVISLQVGVYNKKSDAVKARKKIMSKLNLPVKIVEQWEFYRVIITGFSSREETYQFYPELAGLGFPGPTLIEE